MYWRALGKQSVMYARPCRQAALREAAHSTANAAAAAANVAINNPRTLPDGWQARATRARLGLPELTSTARGRTAAYTTDDDPVRRRQ
jgi:hypothetical protein